MLDIGNTLRKFRNKYGYSQQFIANCLNISRVTYRKWENNEVNFNLNQLEKISTFYEIPLHNIIVESYIMKEKI